MFVDKNMGLEYTGGIEKIYTKLCMSFLQKYANFIEELDESDEKSKFALIHNLKAISLNLGALTLYELIKDNKYDDYQEFVKVFNGTYQEIKLLNS